MASATSVTKQVRQFDADGVRASLDEAPRLLGHRDERGRNWLHLCCSIDVSKRPDDVGPSVTIADDLLARGLDIDAPAFTENDGQWHATPLWYCVARGRNLVLAAHLLDLGCDPNHSLWAAGFNDDLGAIDLLLDHGADIDSVVEQETPFLSAIKSSHFRPAWRLAERGADVDYVDAKGMTALHYMLKKSSDTKHFVAFDRFGPRYDIPGPNGTTAGEALARKRDPALRALVASG
jgi:ankyrin repeat protein